MRSAAALPLHRGRPASAVLRDSRCLACRDFRIAREAGEPRAHNLFGWFAAWCVGGILWSAPQPVGRPFPPKHPAEPRARAKRAESGLIGGGLLLEVEASRSVLKPWLACSATNAGIDRKSTRLNSSHGYISYAVFCLKKKKHEHTRHHRHRTSHRPSIAKRMSKAGTDPGSVLCRIFRPINKPPAATFNNALRTAHPHG